MIEEINRAIKAINRKNLIQYTQELMKVPSLPGEEKETAQILADILVREGMDEVIIDDLSNVFGVLRGSEKKRSLLLASHIDSVPSSLTKDPYHPRVMAGVPFGKGGDVIYGSGTSKGNLIAALLAAKSLVDQKISFDFELIIAGYTRDLLANHDGIRKLLTNDNVNPTAAVITEASDNQIIVGTRGRSELELQVVGKPTHAGRPEKGVNAVYKMMKVLSTIEAMKLPTHKKLGEATLTPIWIECEVKRPNIPHLCSVIFDRRTLPGENPQSVLNDIREICTKYKKRDTDFKFSLTLKKAMLPFEVPEDAYLVTLMKKAGEEVTAKHPELVYSRSFSSDAACLQSEFSVPCFGFGAGRIEDMVEEHVEVTKLIKTAEMYTAFLYLYSQKYASKILEL